ncbi:unnamed protein product [Rodentolepis nana]|uniref:TRAF-type domain-containing protein n=1 Tax=Rodentolepis nana TaxID=102285 RepID=A0A0R3TRX9_RODNA|nr:unnamed protein product [Rodentolepis nana]
MGTIGSSLPGVTQFEADSLLFQFQTPSGLPTGTMLLGRPVVLYDEFPTLIWPAPEICRQPLVDPIDTKCGHTFCTPCLKSHLVVQALCPEDKQIINYLECQQSSNLVKRLLDKLLVICPNSEHCEEILSRCDLESHLAYWCRGTVVPCSNAKTGCQFRAARALQSEHRRECRFQPRTPGTTHVAVSGGSPIVRPIATKSVVRFGPMPAVRRVATEAPLMSAGSSASEETTPSPPTAASSRGCGGGVRSASPIRDCEVTTIELPWKPNASLGISFVGGSDTPLLCIVIQEIYLDGIVAMDGRLRPGDQILEAGRPNSRLYLLYSIDYRLIPVVESPDFPCISFIRSCR